jgi:hypothetical protein
MGKLAKNLGETVVGAGLCEQLIEGPDGKPHRVLVNMGESPCSWLYARKMLSKRQFDAAEALRRDWEKAGMAARTTMNWAVIAVSSRTARSGAAPSDASISQLSARDRLNGALASAGPGLVDILWRVVCACEGMAAAERALNWPARAGKLVLGFALDRVADYYRIA